MIFKEFFLREIKDQYEAQTPIKREFYFENLRIWVHHDYSFQLTRITFAHFTDPGVMIDYKAGGFSCAYKEIPEEDPEGITVIQSRLSRQVLVPFIKDDLLAQILKIENHALRVLCGQIALKGLPEGTILPLEYVESFQDYIQSKPFTNQTNRIKDPTENTTETTQSEGKANAQKNASPETPAEAKEATSDPKPKSETPDDSFEAKVARVKKMQEFSAKMDLFSKHKKK